MKKHLLFLLLPLLLAGCTVQPPTITLSPVTESKSIVDLSNTQLQKIEASFFDTTAITSLNLSHNNLTGALPAEIRKLTKLKTLDVSYNKMTGLPAELGQLTNLEVLDVSYNQLTGLPNELGNLKNLKTFNIGGNKYSKQDLAAIKAKLPNTTFITGN